MTTNLSAIVAVGSTVDFAQLDDPAQTKGALLKAAEEVLKSIHTAQFHDHILCRAERLPVIVSQLKDLYVSIDFLRTPTSKGVMPPRSDVFQLEVATSYRALSVFLSFEDSAISFADWNALTRTIAQLDLALSLFVEACHE